MSKQFLGPKSRLQNRLLFHLSHKVISKFMVYTVEHILVIVDFFGLADKSKVAKQS